MATGGWGALLVLTGGAGVTEAYPPVFMNWFWKLVEVILFAVVALSSILIAAVVCGVTYCC